MSKIIYGVPKTPGKRLTTEDFIKRAREVHGNRYDYSKVVYKNANTKVIIICKAHGEFLQTPNSHAATGCGCPKCVRKDKSTTKEFIEKARKVHGNKYDYSKVVYKNNHTKVVIICPEHGEFKQTPNSHLAGYGCRKCANDLSYKNQILGKNEFIKRSINAHGSKYDYSKVVYKNYHTKVIIICPIHGEFLQKPRDHYNGMNCPKCLKNYPLDTKEFIKRSNAKHGSKYNYSKVIYKNNCTKVTIICPEHGEFKQRPQNHLNGQGCPKCCTKGQDRKHDLHPGFLYLIKSKSFCKIGTAYDIKQRFRGFQFKIIETKTIYGITNDMFKLEQQIKKEFEKYQYIPKVKFGGYTECFTLKAYNQISSKYFATPK